MRRDLRPAAANRPIPAGAPAVAMSRHEREELLKLVRSRERVLKSAASQRSAELLADFEHNISAEYSFDDDALWAESYARAQAVLAEAQKEVEARSAALGIPKDFAPKIIGGWVQRGENALAERRAELRRAAKADIEAMEKRARVQIETLCLNAQTEIVSSGLLSPEAKAFLHNLQSVESLMPALDFKKIELEHRKQ